MSLRQRFQAWVAYYKRVDGPYFYFGRLRHAYSNAKTGVLPYCPIKS